MVASSNTRPKSISGTAAIGGQLTNSNTTENKTNNVESDNSWSSLYGFSSYLFGSSVETKMEQELVDMKGQNPIHGGSSEEAVVIEDANNNEYIGTAGNIIVLVLLF